MPGAFLEQKKRQGKERADEEEQKKKNSKHVKKKERPSGISGWVFLILGITLVVMLIIKINNPDFFPISIMRWIRKQWMHQSLILTWSF